MNNTQDTNIDQSPSVEYPHQEYTQSDEVEEQAVRLFSSREIETLLKQLNEADKTLLHETKARKGKALRFVDAIQDIIDTFNIYPPTDPSRYLRKANIARSPTAALRSDWSNVSKDLSVSFLRGAAKVAKY